MDEITQGSTGLQVKIAKFYLKLLGHYTGDITNDNFDQATKEAVEAFERSKNIDADGKLGGASWEPLINEVASQSGNLVNPAGLKKKVDEIGQQLKAMSDKVDQNLDQKLSTTQSNIQTALAPITNKVNQINQNLDRKLSEVEEEFKTEIGLVKTKVNQTLDRKLSEVEGELKTEIAPVKTKVNQNLDRKLSEVEGELKTEIAPVKTKVNQTLDRKLSEVEDSIKAEISPIKTKVDQSLDLKLSEVQGGVKSEVEPIKNKVDENLDRKLSETQQSIEDQLTTKVGDVESAIDMAATKVSVSMAVSRTVAAANQTVLAAYNASEAARLAAMAVEQVRTLKQSDNSDVKRSVKAAEVEKDMAMDKAMAAKGEDGEIKAKAAVENAKKAVEAIQQATSMDEANTALANAQDAQREAEDAQGHAEAAAREARDAEYNAQVAKQNAIAAAAGEVIIIDEPKENNWDTLEEIFNLDEMDAFYNELLSSKESISVEEPTNGSHQLEEDIENGASSIEGVPISTS